MKLLLVFCAAMAMGTAAENKTAPAHAALKPTTIPAGAVETQPGFYTYTDNEGTRWLLRKTPFGVSAVEEKTSDLVKTTDEGDRVRFEQATPFGTHRWEKKKSEMNPFEREVWERQHEHAAGSR